MKKDKTTGNFADIMARETVEALKREVQQYREETNRQSAQKLVDASDGSLDFGEALKVIRRSRDIDEGRMNFKGKTVIKIEGHGVVKEILFETHNKTFHINDVIIKGLENVSDAVVNSLVSLNELHGVCTRCGTIRPVTDEKGGV